MKTKELRQRRAAMATQMRAILETAEQEKRGLTAEEQANYDKAFKDQDELRQTIERAERQQELDAELAETIDPDGGVETRGGRPTGEREDRRRGERTDRDDARGTEEYRAAYGRWLRGGLDALSSDERRTLSAGSGTEGGFLVAPTQMRDGILKAVDDLVFIRQWATKETVTKAASLGVVTLDSDPDDFEWTTELSTGSEDSSTAFGKRELTPHPMAKRTKISNKLLRAAGTDPEAIVRGRLSYKSGITQEKVFMTGHGANQPLGIFTASNDGIPTGRDVSAGNTTTGIGADGLLAAKYALKGPYRNKARWLFHRDAVLKIAQLKDGNNQYLWQPGLVAGQPDRLLNLPVFESEYVPNTFTAGKYVGILGEFSFYWIVDALDLQIQRLVELYAEENKTGFILRQELDGQPVMAEAFARVTLAAS